MSMPEDIASAYITNQTNITILKHILLHCHGSVTVQPDIKVTPRGLIEFMVHKNLYQPYYVKESLDSFLSKHFLHVCLLACLIVCLLD